MLNNLENKNTLFSHAENFDPQEMATGIGFILLQVLLVAIVTTLIRLGPENWGALP